MMIIAVDNLNRDHVADVLLLGGIPDTPENRAKAADFCNWMNTFSCTDHGGYFHTLVESGYRLSRGMDDLV